jgi:hypothetical protein
VQDIKLSQRKKMFLIKLSCARNNGTNIEGPEKATRGEGWMGANQNSSTELGLYPNTRFDVPLFQLSQDRTAIANLSAFGIGLGTATETWNGASKTTREINDKNQLKKQFISSKAFHRTPGGRVRETAAGERFRPRILETFDPVAQA